MVAKRSFQQRRAFGDDGLQVERAGDRSLGTLFEIGLGRLDEVRDFSKQGIRSLGDFAGFNDSLDFGP